MKKKICVIITARPSYSRVKTVLESLSKKNVELQIITSATANLSIYGDVSKIIEDDGFNILKKFYNNIEGTNKISMAKTTALSIIDLCSFFNLIKPDAIITIADRFETLSTSIAASYLNIKLIHLQGGEISGNIDNKVRNANSSLADIHFVCTDQSKTRVKSIATETQHIYNYGCPSIDLVKKYSSIKYKFNYSDLKGVGDLKYNDKDYVLVMQHPVTNSKLSTEFQIEQTLSAIKKLNMNTIWFWPNADSGADKISKRLRIFRENEINSKIYFIKNLPPKKFIPLINNSKCLIGNSSLGIRECSFLGIPVVNIGERQINRERGNNVVNSDYNSKEIFKKIKLQIKRDRFPSELIFGKGNSGKKIAEKIIQII